MNKIVNDENQSDLVRRYRHTVSVVDALMKKYRRQPESIRLIAVSKRHPADQIAQLVALGHLDFGENYLQEALQKIQALGGVAGQPDEGNRLYWHFIGHIQSRKCKAIAENFDWVHTIDNENVACKLNRYRTARRPLNVLAQLNLQQEAAKSGVTADALPVLCNTIKSLPNLKLRGLMIIPRVETGFDRQRVVFQQCREVLDKLNACGLQLDQLSMGMSSDLEAAVAEGATQVRIGTAIFGPRS